MLARTRRNIAAAIGVITFAVQPALADPPRTVNRGYQAADQYTYARVVDVKPLIRTVEVEIPVRECFERPVTYETRPRGSAGRTIAGGIIGGLIGNQFGDGRGRDAMTVLGTVIGASAAERRNPAQIQTRNERFCETRYEYEQRDRVEGYRVTYLYKGDTYTTRTSTDPGNRIRVRVRVEPLVD